MSAAEPNERKVLCERVGVTTPPAPSMRADAVAAFLLLAAASAPTAAVPTHVPVVCIGGGVAGLLAGRELARAGVGVRVLEASDRPGGRVRSDVVEGFTLDRGFQVFLTAYPETRAALDYAELDLRPFVPGALVQAGPGEPNRHCVADPLRRPSTALATLAFPLGTPADKARSRSRPFVHERGPRTPWSGGE